MKPENRTDFTVMESEDKHGNPRWRVMVAKSILVSVARTKEAADEMAKQLNLDPWFLDRGQTRADRNKRA